MLDLLPLSSLQQIDAALDGRSSPNGHHIYLSLGEQNCPSPSMELPSTSTRISPAADPPSHPPVTPHFAAQPFTPLMSPDISVTTTSGELSNISPEVPKPVTCEQLGKPQSIDYMFFSPSQTPQTPSVAAIDNGTFISSFANVISN